MSQQVKVYRELNLEKAASITGFKVATKTADYTVTTTDSGTIFIANHASTIVNFTLPATASCNGLAFLFVNLGAAGFKVTAGTADTMVVMNDAEADSAAFSTTNEMIGTGALVVGDGSKVYFLPLAPEAYTITVVTE